jgi:hypothetical protein
LQLDKGTWQKTADGVAALEQLSRDLSRLPANGSQVELSKDMTQRLDLVTYELSVAASALSDEVLRERQAEAAPTLSVG